MPDEEGRWVTINGAHILIGGSGDTVTIGRLRGVAEKACNSRHVREWDNVGIRVQNGLHGAEVGSQLTRASRNQDTGARVKGVSAFEVNLLATASGVGFDIPGDTILVLGSDGEVAAGEEEGEIVMHKPTVLEIISVSSKHSEREALDDGRGLMPYTKANAPDAVKALPTGAQDIWIAAYNAAFIEYKGDEGKSAATAWSAVEKAGYRKNEKGEWVKIEEHTEDKDRGTGEEKKEPPKKEEHAEQKEEFKEYEGVIRAAAILGADIPELKTLKDITALGENGDAEIEIFEAGYHRGKFFDLAFLDRAVKHFGELKEKIKPPLKAGHKDEQELAEAEGRPALGWMKGVRREGRKLVASFSDVPERLREAIRQNRFKRVSVEFYPTLNLAEEKNESLWLFAERDTKGGDKKMEKFTEEEVKLREDEAREEAEAKFRDELAKAKFAERTAAKKLLELQARAREGEVKAFTESLTKSGLAPAIADMAKEIFSGLDAEKPEKFAEGTVEKTRAEYFCDLFAEIAKHAQAKTLFVEAGEKASGAEHKGFQEKDADADKKEIAEMVGTVQAAKVGEKKE
jgi:cation transport regulator ChaB